ncbi:MAG: hypothetical protein E6R14_08995 [Thermomicrobiales bacterium]|nr:hypothetical protein [Fimbriimonadaceae bacterium]TXG80580.1 MAG: hypothetical protein E6R14_08995 [Thermomicrobiales bacterium]
MMGIVSSGRAWFGGLTVVRSSADLAHLVKEAEVLSGLPGRRFVVAGADRIEYRISVGQCHLEVARLGNAGEALHTEVVSPEDIDLHQVGEALRNGQLFAAGVE